MFQLKNIFISLTIFIIFSTQSIGYDLYAHSLIYYFNDELITHSYELELLNLLIPRYFLLSYIYEFTREFGIPSGWVAFTLSCVPFLYINNKYGIEEEDGKHKIFFIIYLTCILFVIFYSALTLSLLWLMAFFVSRKPFFILGSFFHPLGAVLSLLYMLSFFKNIKLLFFYSIFFTLFLLISWIDSYYNFFKSISNYNIRYVINLSNIYDLLIYSFFSKINEILLLAFIIFLSFLFRYNSLLTRFINCFLGTLSTKIVVIFFLTLLFINALIRDNTSLISYIVRDDSSLVVDVTWFSFGSRDSFLNFRDLDESRYKGVYE